MLIIFYLKIRDYFITPRSKCITIYPLISNEELQFCYDVLLVFNILLVFKYNLQFINVNIWFKLCYVVKIFCYTKFVQYYLFALQDLPLYVNQELFNFFHYKPTKWLLETNYKIPTWHIKIIIKRFYQNVNIYYNLIKHWTFCIIIKV